MEINMTLHRTKSILCGLLLLAIAIQPEHHHIFTGKLAVSASIGIKSGRVRRGD
jgi:hypothetical protein